MSGLRVSVPPWPVFECRQREEFPNPYVTMIAVAESVDIDRELVVLEAELKRLEAEYNMYFAGRLPRPPWETRSRVEAMVKRLDRTHIGNTGTRFRFSTLQSRFST